MLVSTSTWLFELDDSAGHVDFSCDVTAALHTQHGAMVDIDGIEGCAVENSSVLDVSMHDELRAAEGCMESQLGTMGRIEVESNLRLLQGRIRGRRKRRNEAAVQDALDWLADDQLAEKEEFEAKPVQDAFDLLADDQLAEKEEFEAKPVQDALDWLADDQLAEKEEFEAKLVQDAHDWHDQKQLADRFMSVLNCTWN